jgi:hypothetical protein
MIPEMVWYCERTPHLILNILYLFMTATLDLRFFYDKMDKSELKFGMLTGALRRNHDLPCKCFNVNSRALEVSRSLLTF